MTSTRASAVVRVVTLTIGLMLLASACASGGERTVGRGSPSSAASQPGRQFVLDGRPMLPCSSAGFDAVCGRLTVLEDRSDADGRTIDLNVVVVPAQDRVKPDEAVFFLSGGPGGAATQDWAVAPSLFPGVHARRDIVLVDQRGTGGSNPLVFEDVPDLAGMSEDEVRAFLPGWVQTAYAGLEGNPRFYTSTVAADDLDEVRAALGYERIDLYGGSYGATLA